MICSRDTQISFVGPVPVISGVWLAWKPCFILTRTFSVQYQNKMALHTILTLKLTLWPFSGVKTLEKIYMSCAQEVHISALLQKKFKLYGLPARTKQNGAPTAKSARLCILRSQIKQHIGTGGRGSTYICVCIYIYMYTQISYGYVFGGKKFEGPGTLL